MTQLESIANQYNNAINYLLEKFHNTITKFENDLIAETARADRDVIMEEYGTATATGSSVLTHRTNQMIKVTSILVNFDAGKDALLTIGRFTQDVNNAQSRVQVIGPVKYLVGPGDVIKLTWSGITPTPTQIPYLAVFGEYVGSNYGG